MTHRHTQGTISPSDGDAPSASTPTALAARMLDDHLEWPGESPCPVRDVLARVGDRWTVLVVLRLGALGPLRFRQLLRAVDGLSQRMLTLTLRNAERDGLVSRQVFATRPPTVEYALTPLGESMLVPVRQLAEWAMAHREEIDAARKTFGDATS